MWSERLEFRQEAPRPRVIKSGQAGGLRFAFPALEQLGAADLLPSRTSAPAALGRQARADEPDHPSLGDLDRLRAAARESEARARALERRASAVLREAEETAALRIREAQERVQQMLVHASEAADQAEIEAREHGVAIGREEGYLAGLQMGQLAAEEVLGAARAQAEAIRLQAEATGDAARAEALSQRAELIDSTGGELLDLAFAVARQVIRTELALRPTAMIPMLEAALLKLKGEAEPMVRVSPTVVTLLDEHRSRLMAASPGMRRLQLDADAGLEDGDFVVQGVQGSVDGRLDRQLRVLHDQIRTEAR